MTDLGAIPSSVYNRDETIMNGLNVSPSCGENWEGCRSIIGSSFDVPFDSRQTTVGTSLILLAMVDTFFQLVRRS